MLRRVKKQTTVDVNVASGWRGSKYVKAQELLLECGHAPQVRELRANQKQVHWDCTLCRVPTKDTVRPTMTADEIAIDLFRFGRDKASMGLTQVLRHEPGAWHELKRILDPNYPTLGFFDLWVAYRAAQKTYGNFPSWRRDETDSAEVQLAKHQLNEVRSALIDEALRLYAMYEAKQRIPEEELQAAAKRKSKTKTNQGATP